MPSRKEVEAVAEALIHTRNDATFDDRARAAIRALDKARGGWRTLSGARHFCLTCSEEIHSSAGHFGHDVREARVQVRRKKR